MSKTICLCGTPCCKIVFSYLQSRFLLLPDFYLEQVFCIDLCEHVEVNIVRKSILHINLYGFFQKCLNKLKVKEKLTSLS